MAEYKKLLVLAVGVSEPLDAEDDSPYWQAIYAIREYVESPAFKPEVVKDRLMDIPEGPGEVRVLVARVENS